MPIIAVVNPITILIAVGAFLVVVCLYIAFKKSPKFDQVVKDITEPVNITSKTTDGVIKDISAAEKALQQKAKATQDEADKLQKESTKIGDYLANKGVVKPKGKETNDTK